VFKNIRIGTKLLAAFLAVSSITLLIGLIGYFGAARLGDDLEEVAVVRLPSIMGLAYINEAQTAIQRAERTLMIQGLDPKESEHQIKRLDEAWGMVSKGLKIYEPLPQTKEEEALWKQFVPAWDKWKKQQQLVMSLLAEGKRDQALALSFGDCQAAQPQRSKNRSGRRFGGIGS
jgi:methyl-accepting chemotaxis protein